jgi:hypothetical protein
MNSRLLLTAALVVAAIASAPARALDGMSFEVGRGDDVTMGRVGLQWELARPVFRFGTWHVATYVDLAAGYWNADSMPGMKHDELFDIGITPVMRLQRNERFGPYAELGLGAHVLTHTSIGLTRMSTAFQFGNHVGLGYRFGPKTSYDLSYRFQHLSNAGIKHPNAGINFHQVRLQYWF